MPTYGPQTPAADELHALKYRRPGEDFRDSMNRVAFGLKDSDKHYHEFRQILLAQRFCPGGRIQGAIGSGKNVTAYNCFTSGTFADSFVDGQGSIMSRAHEAAATMRMGGGIGYDFSVLRPRGDIIRRLQSQSSGPVSFMHIFDAVCLATSSSGHRRGAQMGVLRCDHPDIEEFIRAKQNAKSLLGFNISVAITDDFMEAVAGDKPFDLKFQNQVYKTISACELWENLMRSTWDYAEPGVIFIDTINQMNNLYYAENIATTNPCFAAGTLVVTDKGAKPIESLIGKSVQIHDGVDWQTVDNFRVTGVNQPMLKITLRNGAELRVTPAHKMILENHEEIQANELQIGYKLAVNNVLYNLHPSSGMVVKIEDSGIDSVVYCCTVNSNHKITLAIGVITGQCGEQPLPPFGACLLGSFNLVKYLKKSTNGTYYLDYPQLEADIPLIVRAMDNVVDRTTYPLAEQKAEAKSKRRMGLGVMGLANAIESMGKPYGSPEFIDQEHKILSTITLNTYSASVRLAQEKGPFDLFDAERYCKGQFIQRLPKYLVDQIRTYGIRNSHLTSIAPTGTISLCADNVSGGIEPVFAYETQRPINTPDGPKLTLVQDYGVAYLNTRGKLAADVSASAHVAVLAAAQKHVDSAVSKTVNTNGKMPWNDFKEIYRQAWELGCKGCATFNSDGKRMALLAPKPKTENETQDPNYCLVPDPVTGQKDCG